MIRRLNTLAAVVVFAGLSGAAHAQMGPGGGRAPLDADGDGKVTAAEFDAAAVARFKRMDRNGDGIIDKAELAEIRKMTAERAPGRPDMTAELDADKDGQITQAEAAAAQKASFAALDKNGDGVLDAAELAAMRR
ncbi:MAG: hypothetical protein JWP92_1051 [Caulobacter sp.]|nr:hypothetical protein [Caulobacter sp.]